MAKHHVNHPAETAPRQGLLGTRGIGRAQLVYGRPVTAWLRDERGIRIALPASGLVVGRSADCHVVVEDPLVSRRHAVLLEAPGGVRVVPLGKRPVRVDDRPHDPSTILAHGARIAFERVSFVLETAPTTERPAPLALALGDRRVTVPRAGLYVGGGGGEDVVIPGWPPRAVELSMDGERCVATRHARVSIDGLSGVGDAVEVGPGSLLEAAGMVLTIVPSAPAATTLDAPTLPSRVELELVPNGGIARFFVDREIAVWLPQRRCDLVATLLRPPQGIAAGDFVDDQLVLPRVWPGEAADRAQLNTLIHRTRLTLTEAGLPGSRWIERAQGGGATRFLLAPGASVRVL
jgi:hypothetical protein